MITQDLATILVHTTTAITVKQVIASISLNGVTQFGGIAHCGKEQRMSEDKAIHVLYERIGHLLCEQPYGELGRYLTYYAEDRLYLVFDLWYHGFFLVEAKSPKDAIEKVNCDQLTYLPKGVDDETD